MKKILIIGATSAIVKATARLWAQQGHSLYLVARNREQLHKIAQDLRLRGAGEVHSQVLDLNDFDKHNALIQNVVQTLGQIDIVLIGHGTLGNQHACEEDFNLTLLEFNTNATSIISLLTHIANYFESRQQGVIAVINSVAGERGRQSNYVYGSAKAAVSVFMQGLRQRLFPANVKVLTIKPGFVDTPMTGKLKKGILWVSPEYVARKIDAGVKKAKNVIYVPWFWYGIMSIIRLIPEGIFKRVKL